MQEKKKNSYLVGWFICIIGAIFFLYEYLLRIEPSVMVMELMEHFKVMATGFGFIIAFYYYAYTPMQLIVGVLIDRYGSRLMIGLGIILCTLGCFLFSIANSVYLGSAARFLIGLGSSFAFVGVLKLGTEWLPKKHFALFVGLTTALGMFGGMTGDIFLTSLMQKIGWQNILHLSTVVGVVLIPVILIFVHDTPTSKTSPVRLNTNFSKTYSGLKKMIRNPQMWLCGIIGGTLYLSLTAFAELWGIKFLESTYNLENGEASIACSMVFLGWLVGSPLSGWFSDYIKSRKKPIIFGGFASALMISLVILNPLNASFSFLCLLLLFFGIFSSTEIICFAISREINPHHISGSALAFTNFLVMLGGMIFQPLLGILLDLLWDGKMIENTRIYSPSDYRLVFLIIPLCLVIGAFLAFMLKETLQPEKLKKVKA
jgi:MFS family permease